MVIDYCKKNNVAIVNNVTGKKEHFLSLQAN